jgi:MFS family permease
MSLDQSLISNEIEKRKRILAWTITLVGSLFFFYAFFQVNIMAPLNTSLQQYFHVDAGKIGLLSAWCFYANVIFFLPAGLMLDRLSIRKIMIGGMGLTIIGTFIFAAAPTLLVAGIGRFLTGITLAFGLIACLKLATLWMPPNKMAMASSLIVTIGSFGAIASQILMNGLNNKFGWQSAVNTAAIVGVAIAAILWIVVRDPIKTKTTKDSGDGETMTIRQSLLLVLKKKQNWYIGSFTCFLNFPVAILGALFGTSYVEAYGFSNEIATYAISMLFFGMIIGSPFFGWLSDTLKNRRMPMAIGSVLCLSLLWCLLFFSIASSLVLITTFFFIGFFAGAQVIGYPLIAENNNGKIAGTALSFAAMIIMGVGYGVGLPFVGRLLKMFWDGSVVNGAPMYSLSAYNLAFISLPISIIISLVMTWLIKETKCKSIAD